MRRRIITTGVVAQVVRSARDPRSNRWYADWMEKASHNEHVASRDRANAIVLRIYLDEPEIVPVETLYELVTLP